MRVFHVEHPGGIRWPIPRGTSAAQSTETTATPTRCRGDRPHHNNMTGGADIAVDRVADRINQRFPGVKFERYGGDLRPGRPALSRGNHIDEEEAARIATEVDAMIGATAH